MPRTISSESRKTEAERIRDLRKLLGMSQRELASEFGVAAGAVAQWEQGDRTIPGSVLRLMDIYEENLGMINKPNKPLRKINSSWFSRTLKSSSSAAVLAMKLAEGSMRQLVVGNERALKIKDATQQAIAHQLADHLGDMKGLLMKFGQMISYMDFAMPENARQLLAGLQDSTKPMEPAVIRKVIFEEFGKYPEEIFLEWAPYPFAAASIGQVHRAKLPDGTLVAVKVQYPEIIKSINSDLANAAVFQSLGSVLFRNQDHRGIFEELKERVLEECDYQKEAKNIEDFADYFKGDKDIVIPRVYKNFSSKRVITTEFINGKKFSEFLATGSQEDKNKAGLTLFRMAFTSIFKHHLFNCDPHPGNYLFFDNGRVAFIDFGCVRRFDNEFISWWKKLAKAILEQDKDFIDKLMIKIGYVVQPEKFDFEYNRKMIATLYEPCMQDNPYKFTRHYVKATWNSMIVENLNRFTTNLPREWLFTNRLQWGLYSVLAELGAEANWRSIYLGLVYGEGEKWPKAMEVSHGL